MAMWSVFLAAKSQLIGHSDRGKGRNGGPSCHSKLGSRSADVESVRVGLSAALNELGVWYHSPLLPTGYIPSIFA